MLFLRLAFPRRFTEESANHCNEPVEVQRLLQHHVRRENRDLIGESSDDECAPHGVAVLTPQHAQQI